MNPVSEDESRWWRLISKFKVDDGCWTWTAALNSEGYGSFAYATKDIRGAHRVLYEILVGPVPEGMVLDHLCHNADAGCPGGRECPHRACVNPSHLSPVTDEDNGRTGRQGHRQRSKTHCVNEHEFTPENTYIGPNDPNHRQCRRCRADRARTMSASVRVAGG